MEVRVKLHVPRELRRPQILHPGLPSYKSRPLMIIWLITVYVGLNILMTASLQSSDYLALGQSRFKQHLAFLEAIAIPLYCPTLKGRRSNLIYFDSLGNLVGIVGVEFFFNWTPLLSDILYSFFKSIPVYFGEKAPDERVASVCFIILMNKIWFPYFTPY